MIEVHAEFPQREVIQANAVVDNEEKTVSEVIISAKPEITGVTASVDNETGTPYVDVTETGTGTEYSFDLAFHNLKGDKGDTGATGQTGATGNGISTIEKTSSSGLVDTYTITFTNGNSTTFNVTNGNGIADISKTSTSGLVDTYTITYDNGDTDTFTVTNGKDGIDGQDGQAATVTVGTTTTGAAGTNASVVNSGTSSDAILDFTIPKGDKGDTGATGADGFSPSASVTQSGDITTISITDKNGTTTQSIDLSSKQNTLTAGTDIEITSNNTINFTNASGYTTNVGTVTSVNNTQPDANGNVSLTMPTVNNGVLTITQNGTSKGTFSANQSSNDTIALTDTTYSNFTGADGTNAGSSGLVPAPSATDNDKYLKGDGTWASVSSGSSTDVQINGTSITSGGVANILTESAYSASNKIATMSDLPADEIFVAEYNVTTYQQVLNAYNAGKTIFCVIQIPGNNSDYISSLSDIKQDLSEFCFNWTTGKPITFNGTNVPAYFNNCAIKLTSSSVWSYEYTAIPTINYAVNHIPSTAVGSSTKPIYISSTGSATASTSTVGGSSTPVYLNAGTITSTGLSIANSRFDGSIVYISKSYNLVDGKPSINSYSFNLRPTGTGALSYLPNDSLQYEVFVEIENRAGSSSGDVYYTVGNVASPYTAIGNNTSCIAFVTRTNNNSRFCFNGGWLPLTTSGIIYGQAAGTVAGTGILVRLLGYRRIGTNS